jgi:hypothetical protein
MSPEHVIQYRYGALELIPKKILQENLKYILLYNKNAAIKTSSN